MTRAEMQRFLSSDQHIRKEMIMTNRTMTKEYNTPSRESLQEAALAGQTGSMVGGTLGVTGGAVAGGVTGWSIGLLGGAMIGFFFGSLFVLGLINSKHR